MRLTVAGVAAVLPLLAPAGPAAAAPVADDIACAQVRAEDPAPRATAASRPVQVLGIPQARELAGRPAAGQGVRVAVVDSGVSRTGWVRVAARVSLTGMTEVLDGHGTAVAGLVAGRARAGGEAVGVAPGVAVVDVRVYDEGTPTRPDSLPIDSTRVARGLDWLAARADRLGVGVAVVPLATSDDPALREAVARLAAADVVVVAASGNRPTESTDPLFARFSSRRPGEDAAGAVFPAGYDSVLAVSATADGAPGDVDARDLVLASSAVDVAAPTYDAVSVSLNGGTCLLPEVATSWAAAEVAGVVALLRARYPQESAPQIVARLVATADGSPVARSLLTGAGVVQPVEALTRPVHPAADGSVAGLAREAGRFAPATAPDERPETAAALRERMLRWALLGSAGLALALVLRPLLRRTPGRRDRSPG